LQLVEEAPGVSLVLKPDDEVVGVAHEDHVARGLTPSPARGPEVERVVQIDVGKQRRDYSPYAKGNFTSHQGKKGTRTELIIFIRPQIIRDGLDAHHVAEELRAKLRGSVGVSTDDLVVHTVH